MRCLQEEMDCIKTPSPTPPEKVSVLQKTISARVPPQLKYNPEIELSTDTEDSASESSEKHQHDYVKLEEVLKTVIDEDIRDKVLELFKNLSKERELAVLETRLKDQDRITELERRNSQLERENSDLKKELEDLRVQAENNNQPLTIRDNIIVKDSSTELVTSSSIIQSPPASVEKEPASPTTPAQKSVIASVLNGVASSSAEAEVIKTAPEWSVIVMRTRLRGITL